MMLEESLKIIERPSQNTVNLLINEIKQIFGDRLLTSLAAREFHARDFSSYEAVPPDAVVMAETTGDVVSVVQACAK